MMNWYESVSYSIILNGAAVIPAKAGIQKNDAVMLDSRLRGNDEN